jgi:hypothetical protein
MLALPKISKNKSYENPLNPQVLIHEASDEGAWFDPGPRFDAQWWMGATCSGFFSLVFRYLTRFLKIKIKIKK